MKVLHTFMNPDEGFAACCWETPSKEELAELFQNADAPFERMISVD